MISQAQGANSNRGFKILCGLIVGIVVLGLGIAVIRAANRDDGVSTQQRVVPSPSPGPANLGTAPQGAEFNKTYQERVEQSLATKMGEIKAAQEAADRANSEKLAQAMTRLNEIAEQMKRKNDEASRSPAPGSTAGVSTGERSNAQPEPAPAAVDRRTAIIKMGAGGAVARGGSAGAPAGQFIGTPNDVSAIDPTLPTSAGVTPVAARTDAQPREPFVVPESGFGQGRLLNGVVATHKGDFRYTMIKLEGPYTSANDFHVNLDGCTALGEATAAFGEGRINIKPIKLTCTLPSGRTRSWKTSGYVVDSTDGIAGVIGEIDNNQGKRVASVTGTTALEKIGQVLVARESTQIFNPTTGQGQSLLTGNPSAAVAGSIVQGAGAGLRQELRDYFDLFKPSVQVGGGGMVTVFLLTESELPEGGEVFSLVRSANNLQRTGGTAP